MAWNGKMWQGVLLCGLAMVVPVLYAADPTGEEVVKACDYKNPGQDQRSRLSIVLIGEGGDQRKNVYRRLWKNYHGKDDVVDKMVLYTEFPPEAKRTGFMRVGYTAASGKMADQWLYLPQLRKVRRVSVRDPGDSFLGSDLTYGDIDERPLDADEHVLLRTEEKEGRRYLVVESKPKETDAQYSKRVSWFMKPEDWKGCVRVKTNYYDRQGDLLKVQDLTWQEVSEAWVWDYVEVENVQNGHKSLFEMTDVEIDVGLKERLFTERALKKGYNE